MGVLTDKILVVFLSVYFDFDSYSHQYFVHYMLYLYDRARNDLIERSNEQGNLLQSVVQRSKQICMKVCRSEVMVKSMYSGSQIKLR